MKASQPVHDPRAQRHAQIHQPEPVLPSDAQAGGSPEPQSLLSIVIPTLNSERTLAACLSSIRSQCLPAGIAIEIVMADAGSTDQTLAIAAQYAVETIVPNPLKTGEAGKSVGIAASRGDFLALIDSDNVLPDRGWLAQMCAPFADEQIVACEPWAYTWRADDPSLTRYFALLGMNDPLCLFLGNYDRQCAITGRWTGLPVAQQDRGAYLELALTVDTLPTIGANGFIFRRRLLAGVRWQPYFFDIDVVQQAVARSCGPIAKVKCGIVHLYCDRLGIFADKQIRRIRDFLFFADERQRTYPWRRQRLLGVVAFGLGTVTVVPALLAMLAGIRRKRDWAWCWHLPVCWVTLCVYGWCVLRQRLGHRPRALDRTRWQQRRTPRT